MKENKLLAEHYKLMHFGWLLGEAKMAKRITSDEFRWLVNDAGEQFIAKIREEVSKAELTDEDNPYLDNPSRGSFEKQVFIRGAYTQLQAVKDALEG